MPAPAASGELQEHICLCQVKCKLRKNCEKSVFREQMWVYYKTDR